MSRRKDGGYPRRKGGNSNKALYFDKNPHAPGKLEEAIAGPSRRGDCNYEKPPPDLKGKALGLWYRDRNAKKPPPHLKEKAHELLHEDAKKMKEDKPRPPPGLKGKALGLWYKDRSKHSEEKTLEVKLPRSKFEEIEQLLFNVGPIGSGVNLMVEGKFKNDFFCKIDGTFEENLSKVSFDSQQRDLVLDEQLKTALREKKEKSRIYQDVLNFRKKLPAFSMREKLIKVIENNQVVVISGETGCGKTTQVVQFIMDHYIEKGCGSTCSVICTQPRRISAISVAERVAQERDEPIGQTVGYQIRLEKVLPMRKQGTILFVTTGILLQWMQSNPALNGISHLFLDEIHERDTLCDFTITFLKQIISKKPTLKVILMSATLNAEHFSNYFGGVPCVEIPGFSFPIEEIYLDRILTLTNFKFPENQRNRSYKDQLLGKNNDIFQHYVLPHVRELENRGHISRAVAAQLSNPVSEKISIELLAGLIHYICFYEDEGAILVFLPGISEISNLHKQLNSASYFNSSTSIIIPLHSTLPTINQRSIFSRPPRGVRKIILATSIAETSITIDDVVYVIDSGYIKMQYLNMTINVSTLESNWVSLANAKQRRGRAGRVKAGKCYKMYTKAREESFEPYPLPEMQRTRLEEVVLQAKMLQLGRVAPFLASVMDPPDAKALNLALEMLRTLNALDQEEKLTPLGFHLAKLPLDPQIGKMILMSAIFGCVDPVLTVAAALSFKDPFMTPFGSESRVREVKKAFAAGQISDHLVLCAAFQGWENATRARNERNYTWDHYLSSNTLYLLRDMKSQFARHLHEMNFLQTSNPLDENGNVNSHNTELIKAIFCSGLYPNVAMVKCVKGRKENPIIILKTKDHPRVELHPRSLCSHSWAFESPFLVYHQMMKSSAIFLHDATMVSPWPLLFFGEKLDIVEFEGVTGIRVDDMIKFNCFKKTGLLIQKLRSHLHWILSSSVSNPGVIDWSQKNKKTDVLRAIVQLITAENEELMLLEGEL